MTQHLVPFWKMNGLGNEILVVDMRASAQSLTVSDVERIASLPLLHFDQLMVLLEPVAAGVDAGVRIYNKDGSQAGACGNGMRIIQITHRADEHGHRTHARVSGTKRCDLASGVEVFRLYAYGQRYS